VESSWSIFEASRRDAVVSALAEDAEEEEEEEVVMVEAEPQ
jgi:hypothetical protein